MINGISGNGNKKLEQPLSLTAPDYLISAATALAA